MARVKGVLNASYRASALALVAPPLSSSSPSTSPTDGLNPQQVWQQERKSMRRTLADGLNLQNYNGKLPKVKVGHGGTLDPFATGVLVIGINSGTKAMASYLNGTKSYTAVGKFGSETDTLDLQGKVVKTDDGFDVSREALEKVLKNYVGEIEQRPPIYSALKKNGRKLYDLARKGEIEEKDVPMRSVTIHSIELLEFANGGDTFKLSIECGGGVYIRSLIRDVGRELGTVANMVALERSKQGVFDLDSCIMMETELGEKLTEATIYDSLIAV